MSQYSVQERELEGEAELRADIEAGEDPHHPLRRWLERLRARMHAHPGLRRLYLVIVGLLGTVVVFTGIVLIPLPGPGWLIVFLGLAILGTEFVWAKRLTGFAKQQLQRFWAWWLARRDARRTRRAIRDRSRA